MVRQVQVHLVHKAVVAEVVAPEQPVLLIMVVEQVAEVVVA